MRVINLSTLPTKPLRRAGVVRFNPAAPPPPPTPVGTGSTPVPNSSPSVVGTGSTPVPDSSHQESGGAGGTRPYPPPVGTGSTPVPDPTPPRNPLSIPKALQPWLAPLQTRVLRSALRDEEGQWFADKLRELEKLIADMPHTYQTEHQSDDEKKVWLHYFAGGSANWYLIEKDKGAPGDTPEEFQSQMFGLADLFGDGGELGYISLPELLRVNAELDFHFTPCTLAELRAQRQRRQDDRDAAEQAAAQEFDQADDTPSPLPMGEGQGEGERSAALEDGTVEALLARGWAFENINRRPAGEGQGEEERPSPTLQPSITPPPSPLPDASAPGAVLEPVIENHILPEPMPAETPTPAKNPNVILLQRDKECKGSVRFATPDDTAAITNAYVSRSLPGVNSARQIRLTIEVLP